jgi:hypothetical protein
MLIYQVNQAETAELQAAYYLKALSSMSQSIVSKMHGVQSFEKEQIDSERMAIVTHFHFHIQLWDHIFA